MATLDHNPFAWFTNAEEIQKNHPRIREERADYGISWWDWINFDEFYLTSIRKVSEHYAAGDIPKNDVLTEGFDKIDVSIKHLLELEERSEQRLPFDEVKTVELAKDAEIVKMVGVFFGTVLPSLPFAEGEYEPTRADREDIIADVDLPVIGSHMRYTFLRAVDMFLDHAHGYPANLKDENEWNDILRQMRDGMNAVGPQKQMSGVVLDLLSKYYTALWD